VKASYINPPVCRIRWWCVGGNIKYFVASWIHSRGFCHMYEISLYLWSEIPDFLLIAEREGRGKFTFQHLFLFTQHSYLIFYLRLLWNILYYYEIGSNKRKSW
jgi:hypothetical protein